MAAVLTALTQDGVAVFGVDQLPQKLSAAEALGASATYTPQQAAAAGVKADVVIEAAGHPAALETAIGLTAPGGRTITVGLPRRMRGSASHRWASSPRGAHSSVATWARRSPAATSRGSCRCGNPDACRWNR